MAPVERLEHWKIDGAGRLAWSAFRATVIAFVGIVLEAHIAAAQNATGEIAALFACYTQQSSGAPDECSMDTSEIFSSVAECERILAIEPKPYIETTRAGTHVVKFVCMKKTVPAWEPVQ